MSRYWAILPVIAIVGAPIWDDPSDVVIAIAGTAATVCILGLLLQLLALVTAGAVIATIGYAVAAHSGGGADVVAAAGFGLALLALLDISEFARRTHGAAIAAGVLRDQLAFWFARAAISIAAIAALLLCSVALAAIVPGPACAVVAGGGAVIAFAGALRSGIGRPGR